MNTWKWLEANSLSSKFYRMKRSERDNIKEKFLNRITKLVGKDFRKDFEEFMELIIYDEIESHEEGYHGL